jgi:hypothetical protein
MKKILSVMGEGMLIVKILGIYFNMNTHPFLITGESNAYD